MSVIIFIIILLVLVLVHEFGHFFSAKSFGIRVDEFGFGFPPKLFGIKIGETLYSLNLLPIGGFVKIFGENPDDENTYGADSARSFVNKSKYKQAIVLLAGIFMNLLLAWVLISIGFMSGLPTSLGNNTSGHELENINLVVVSVEKGSPAEMGGLKSGDKIVYLNDGKKSIKNITPETLKSFVVAHGEEEIELGYIRGRATDDPAFTKITPTKTGSSKTPTIGISMDQIGTMKLPFFTAVKEGLQLTLNLTKDTTLGLYRLIIDSFRGRGNLDAVTGPVGLVSIVGDAYSFGFVYLLSFTALISINLAIINLFPFPALDGGRLLFLLIEKIKGSPMNHKIINRINVVGFSLLIILMLFVTYHDIMNLF